MKNYKSFNYFGWDVDDEDPLYKKLILKNKGWKVGLHHYQLLT